jgi:uncharacterized membrane protein
MGVLHPLLVHLPIGFLLLAVLFDLLAYRAAFAQYRAALPQILFLGFGAALLSCGTGYLLSQSGEYARDSLQAHQWGGWAVAGISGGLYLLLRRQSGSKPWLSALLLGLAALLMYTGHQGGSLTHGSAYLSLEAIQNEQTKPRPALAQPDSHLLQGPAVNPQLPLELKAGEVEKLRSLGCNVRILLKRPVMLDVTLPSQSGRSMADLSPILQVLAPSIVWLNLSDNGFSEKDLQVLASMKNLEKLRLAKNPIGDGIVEILAGLKHLEAVNLNETQVSSAALERLQRVGVARVYGWGAAGQVEKE